MSVECPRCHFRFPLEAASRGAFKLFHALRDEYAHAQAMNLIEAKDTLCVMFGVSVEIGDDFLSKLPPWPGVFCEVWGRRFFRKSTLAYSKDEMTKLIEGSQEAVHERTME